MEEGQGPDALHCTTVIQWNKLSSFCLSAQNSCAHYAIKNVEITHFDPESCGDIGSRSRIPGTMLGKGTMIQFCGVHAQNSYTETNGSAILPGKNS